MSDEAREYHPHREAGRPKGASIATAITAVIVLLILGFLLWSFLPSSSGGTTNDNANSTAPGSGQNNNIGGTGSPGTTNVGSSPSY